MRTQEEIEMLEAEQEKQKNAYVTVTSVPSTPSEEAGQPSTPTHETTFIDRADKWWLWELAAWVIAVLSLMGIVILLRTQAGKEVPKWTIRTPAVGGKTIETKITINAIISLFSTVLKSTIMIPIAASMAQLKWLWFHDGNRLSDVQLFDAANRGPLGSILLIWQMRGRQIVCLGALVIISMLGLDFSFQSIVTYPPMPIRIGSAVVPVTSAYTASTMGVPRGFFGDQAPVPVPLLKSAMRASIYDIQTSYDISPTCSTGNCTWTKQYASIGICSECQDATSVLNVTCGALELPEQAPYEYCNYTWPGTSEEPGINGIPGIDWPSGSYTSEGVELPYTTLFVSRADLSHWMSFNYFFKDVAEPVSLLSVMKGDWSTGNLSSVQATQCALKMCVKRYEATMEKNVFTERVTGTFENKTAVTSTINVDDGTYQPFDYMINPPESFFEHIDAKAPKKFYMNSTSMSAINGVFESLGGAIYRFPVNKEEGHNDATDHLYSLDHEGITALMESMANNMTNAMRMSNVNITSETNPNGIGDLMQDVPIVHVRWAWLALPVLELALTMVFLLLTMQVSNKHNGMLWKGSALAPFYHPLTKDGRDRVGSAMTPRQMENVATTLKVKWQDTGNGLRLVQH